MDHGKAHVERWAAMVSGALLLLVAAVSGCTASAEAPASSAPASEGAPSAKPATEPPSQLRAHRDGLTVDLSWKGSPSGSSEDGVIYDVTRNGKRIGSAIDTAFEDTPGKVGQTFTYTVTAAMPERARSTPSEPAKVRIPNLPVSAARVDGKYDMQTRVTGASAEWHRLDAGDVDERWTWYLTATCKQGPCSTLSLRLYGGHPVMQLTLHRHGASYEGSFLTEHWYCDIGHGPSSVTVSLRPSRAAVMGDQWLATSLEGTMRIRFPASSACSAGWANEDVKGTRQN